MSEYLEQFRVCENCPNQAVARRINAANEQLEQLPAESIILARELLRLGNCERPRVELDLVSEEDGDVISVERTCNNPYLHDIYRVLRAGEIIRSHEQHDRDMGKAE